MKSLKPMCFKFSLMRTCNASSRKDSLSSCIINLRTICRKIIPEITNNNVTPFLLISILLVIPSVQFPLPLATSFL